MKRFFFSQNCRFYFWRKNNLTGGVIKPTKALNFGIGLSFQRISRQILIRSAILHNQLIHPCKHTPLTTSLQPKKWQKKTRTKIWNIYVFWGTKDPGELSPIIFFLALIHFVQWLLKTIKDAKSTFVQYLIICPLSQ